MKTRILLGSLLAAVLGVTGGCSASHKLQARAKEKPDGAWTESLTAAEERLSHIGRNRYFILEPGYQLLLEGKEGRKSVRLTITVLDETRQVAGVRSW